MSVDVFVSYAHDDTDRVRPIVDKFKAADFSVWWDRDTGIGERWRNIIEKMLVTARSVCVIWSRNAIDRDFVREEAQRGHQLGKLVPILLDKIVPPLGFGEVQYASLFDQTKATTS